METDPIVLGLQWLYSIWNGLMVGTAPSVRIVMAAACVSMSIILVAWVLRVQQRRRSRDMYWAGVCRFLMGRIRGNMPAYEAAMTEWSIVMIQHIDGDEKLKELVKSIKVDTMIKAEKDFCTYDFGNAEVITNLISQIKTLKENKP